MRVRFYTLGCKVNQYETEVLKQQFFTAGFDIVEDEEAADIIVVNSCTVTATGDKKARQALRRMKRQNEGAVGVLCGCYPQAFPEESGAIPEADIVAGTYDRHKLVGYVKEFLETGQKVVRITPHERGEAYEPMELKAFSQRTRAFVKIQDGCDRYCAYCIIPMARGPVRSKPIDEIKKEIENLAEAGFKEVVLVGINLPCYGKDTGGRLVDAVEAVCAVPGIQRVRLSSLEPEMLTLEEVERMAACPEFCPSFHLSLQSGCDKTLKQMNRHYVSEEYMGIVKMLRQVFPNCAITTDVIVGFPGESKEDFAQSVAFCHQVSFAKVHVFPYSNRSGTRASRMGGQLTRAEIEHRSKVLVAEQEKDHQAFLKRQIGTVQPVLFERPIDTGVYGGYTPNYTHVVLSSGKDLTGEIKEVRITGISGESCIGELAERQGNSKG